MSPYRRAIGKPPGLSLPVISDRRMNDAMPAEDLKWKPAPSDRLTVRVDLAIQIRNNVFECGDGLLDRGDLFEFVVSNRSDTISERDDKFSSVLLQLDKRQTMVWWVLHLGFSG